MDDLAKATPNTLRAGGIKQYLPGVVLQHLCIHIYHCAADLVRAAKAVMLTVAIGRDRQECFYISRIPFLAGFFTRFVLVSF